MLSFGNGLPISGLPSQRMLVRAAELVLVAIIAVQSARAATTLLAPPELPANMLSAAPSQPVSTTLLGRFDPFFRLQPEAPAVVTSLALTLHGIRQDRASGRGSAIIGTPDGTQRSFAVGEEIVPGAVLSEVGFDKVGITRGGAVEELYMAQAAAPAEDPAPEM